MASDLFNFKNVKNNVHRSSFDLSNVHSFTAKAGELLPVYTKITMPGDKFKLTTQHFTRTRPLQSAAFGRVKEYFDWFFVPMRLLWSSFPSTITQMQDNPQRADNSFTAKQITSDMPYLLMSDIVNLSTSNHHSFANAMLPHSAGVNLSDIDIIKDSRKNHAGLSRFNSTLKLLQYLGYGNFTKEYDDPKNGNWRTWSINDVAINPFPLLAYHKIYNDYYRNENWEHSQPWTFNVDYISGSNTHISLPAPDSESWSNPTMFDLRFCNYEKDLFFGILPNSQFGDVSEVLSEVTGKLGYNDPSTKQYKVPDNSGMEPSEVNELQASFNILQLRQAQYLQKWKEIAQSGNHDYKDQIYKHFGVSLSDDLSDLCRFIGGSSNFIDINQVVNTSLDSADSRASQFGNGSGSSNGTEYFECKEHGILMCVYHALPIMSYGTSGIDKSLLKTTAFDYAIPEFDSIGMEVLPEICVGNISNLSLLTHLDDVHGYGYVPRYIDYKTSIDRVSGDFLDTSKDWVQQFTDDDFSIDRNFANASKVNPKVLDNIFGVNADSTVQTDQLLVNANFDVKAVRNLDYNGLPY